MIGKEEWITDPDYATPNARLPRLKEVFATVEAWTMTKTKFEAMDGAQRARHSLRPDPVDGGAGRTNRRCARPAPSSRWTIRSAAST